MPPMRVTCVADLAAAEQFDVRYEQGVYVFGEAASVYNDRARTVQSISKYIKLVHLPWPCLAIRVHHPLLMTGSITASGSYSTTSS